MSRTVLFGAHIFGWSSFFWCWRHMQSHYKSFTQTYLVTNKCTPRIYACNHELLSILYLTFFTSKEDCSDKMYTYNLGGGATFKLKPKSCSRVILLWTPLKTYFMAVMRHTRALYTLIHPYSLHRIPQSWHASFLGSLSFLARFPWGFGLNQLSFSCHDGFAPQGL